MRTTEDRRSTKMTTFRFWKRQLNWKDARLVIDYRETY
jgi:hypothetical protein